VREGDQALLGSAADRRRNLAIAAAFLAVVVILALLAYRPATVLGIEGEALASSVSGVGYGKEGDCREVGEDLWRCEVLDDVSSGRHLYSVQTRGLGCWEAWTGDLDQARDRQTFSGCISLVDVL
jgi:hypothetical protein